MRERFHSWSGIGERNLTWQVLENYAVTLAGTSGCMWSMRSGSEVCTTAGIRRDVAFLAGNKLEIPRVRRCIQFCIPPATEQTPSRVLTRTDAWGNALNSFRHSWHVLCPDLRVPCT